MGVTVVKKCKCVSEYQDKKYGKENRVHNMTVKNTAARCTVCGTVN